MNSKCSCMPEELLILLLNRPLALLVLSLNPLIPILWFPWEYFEASSFEGPLTIFSQLLFEF